MYSLSALNKDRTTGHWWVQVAFSLWSPFTSRIYQHRKSAFQKRNQTPIIFLIYGFTVKLTTLAPPKCWEVLPGKAQFGVQRLQSEPAQPVRCHGLNKQRLVFVFLHMNVFSGAQNQSGKRSLELKYRIFFYLVVLGIFVLEKDLALKPGCLSYIDISGRNLSGKNRHLAGKIFKVKHSK